MFVYLAFKRLYSQVSHVMTLTWNDNVKICNRDAKLSPISASNLLMSFNVSPGVRRRQVHQRNALETLTKVWGKCQKQRAQGLGSSSRVSHMIKQQSKSTPVPCHSWEKAAVAEGRVPGFGEAMSNHDSAKKSPSCWPEETFALCGARNTEVRNTSSLFCTFQVLATRAQSFGCKGLSPPHSFHSVFSATAAAAAACWELEFEDIHVLHASIHLS